MTVLEAEMFIAINHKFCKTRLIFLWMKDHSVSRRGVFFCVSNIRISRKHQLNRFDKFNHYSKRQDTAQRMIFENSL